MERKEVYAAIDSEREYQKLKWGGSEDFVELTRDTGSFLTLMRCHLDEATVKFTKQPNDLDAIQSVLKVAALAVACMEQHGVFPRDLSVVNNQRGQGLILGKDRR